jgi:uncharacterized membrane protein YphA (DoxX/SURF4 family)
MQAVKLLNKWLSHPIVLLSIRIVVGGIFLLFGAIKAFEPKEAFFQSIRDYHILPEQTIVAFAYTMIALEIIVGICFLFGLFTQWAAWGVAGLLLLFIVAITQAIIRGLELSDCGCSGSLIKLGETPGTVLFRDALMFIAVLWFILKKNIKWTLDYWLENHHVDMPGDTHR